MRNLRPGTNVRNTFKNWVPKIAPVFHGHLRTTNRSICLMTKKCSDPFPNPNPDGVGSTPRKHTPPSVCHSWVALSIHRHLHQASEPLPPPPISARKRGWERPFSSDQNFLVQTSVKGKTRMAVLEMTSVAVSSVCKKGMGGLLFTRFREHPEGPGATKKWSAQMSIRPFLGFLTWFW